LEPAGLRDKSKLILSVKYFGFVPPRVDYRADAPSGIGSTANDVLS
jgi:hypothetical protein